MKNFFIQISIANGILILLLFAYIPVVYLNLVFTFKQLPITNIPFYYECSISTLGTTVCYLIETFLATNRLSLTWWLFFFDIFLFALVILPIFNLLILVFKKKRMNLFLSYSLWVGLIAATQTLKIAYLIIGFIFCQFFQICRSYNSADPNVNANNPNWLYIYVFVFSVIFWIYSLVYTFAISQRMNQSIEKYQEVSLAKKKN
jgi:hypothetical protein